MTKKMYYTTFLTASSGGFTFESAFHEAMSHVTSKYPELDEVSQRKMAKESVFCREEETPVKGKKVHKLRKKRSL